MRKSFICFMYLVGIFFVLYSPVFFLTAPRAILESAPDTLFSAHRAFKHVRQIADAPHSIGTDEHASVRNYLISECRKLGLETEVQNTVSSRAIGKYIVAANVNNVIARLKGGVHSGKAVLLLAHYDSDPNTPGAGDNSAGVAAILETVRMLRAGQMLKNQIIVLFTDAEEVGLLGAKAFVSESPIFKEVALVINFEARGNAGISAMFEVNSQNGWVIREYAKASLYPIANSLYYEIYKKLQNDTDYSIFKREGIPGLNHAIVEGYVNYHSMTDTPESLDLNSLQHHGENMASLVRHFGNIKLMNVGAPDVTYFNVIGTLFIYYPGSWNLFFVVVGVLLLVAYLLVCVKKKKVTIKGIAIGFFILPVLTLAIMVILSMLLKTLKWFYPMYDNFYSGNSYNSYYYFFAISALCTASVIQPLMWLSRRTNITSLMIGAFMVVVILMIAVYMIAPTATYFIFFPLFFVIVTQLVLMVKRTEVSSDRLQYFVWSSLGAFPAILLMSPMIYLMFVAFGLGELTPVVVVVHVLLILMMLPLLSLLLQGMGHRITILAFFAFFTALIFANCKSSFTKDKPLQTFVRYELNMDKKTARWVSGRGRIDAGNRLHFPSPKFEVDSASFWFQKQLVCDAPVFVIPPAAITVTLDTIIGNVRKLKLHCLSSAGTTLVAFTFPQNNNITTLRIDDKKVKEDGMPVYRLDCFAFQKNGIHITVEVPLAPFEFWLKCYSIGLPYDGTMEHFPPGVIPAPGYGSNTTIVSKHFLL